MNGTKQLLYVFAAVEAITGIVALLSPTVIVWLLFAIPLTVGGRLIGRLAGIAVISLAIAAWPLRSSRDEASPFLGVLVYNVLVDGFFLIVALRTPFVGMLLWLAIAFHTVMSVLFVLAWRRAAVRSPIA